MLGIATSEYLTMPQMGVKIRRIDTCGMWSHYLLKDFYH
jgi:hypothetical protein